MCDIVEEITINFLQRVSPIGNYSVISWPHFYTRGRYPLQCHGAKIWGAYTASDSAPRGLAKRDQEEQIVKQIRKSLVG